MPQMQTINWALEGSSFKRRSLIEKSIEFMAENNLFLRCSYCGRVANIRTSFNYIIKTTVRSWLSCFTNQYKYYQNIGRERDVYKVIWNNNRGVGIFWFSQVEIIVRPSVSFQNIVIEANTFAEPVKNEE